MPREDGCTLLGAITTFESVARPRLSSLRHDRQINLLRSVADRGAAGGVGSVTVQLAASLGAEVIATCSAADRDFVACLGASTVIDYASEKFENHACDINVVINTVGGETLRRSAAVLRPGGILVGVPEPPRHRAGPPGTVSAPPTSLSGPTGSSSPGSPNWLTQASCARSSAKPALSKRAAEAYASVDHNHRRGKVVLDVRARERRFQPGRSHPA